MADPMDPTIAALNPDMVRKQAAARLFELVNQVGQEAEAQKLAKQETLQSALEQYKPKVDLSPTAALLDSLYGTKLAPTLQQQAQLGDKEDARIMKLQEDLANTPTRRATEANALAKLADGGDANKLNAIQGRFDESQSKNDFKQVYNDYGKERTALDTLNNSYGRIEKALASGNYEQIRSALSDYSRVVAGEKGVLTDADIGRQFIPTANTFLAEIQGRLGNKTGKIPDSDLINLKARVADSRKVIGESYLAKLQEKRANYAESPFAGGLKNNEKFVRGTEALAQRLYAPIQDVKKPAVPGTAPGAQPTNSLRDKLKAFKGEKK